MMEEGSGEYLKRVDGCCKWAYGDDCSTPGAAGEESEGCTLYSTGKWPCFTAIGVVPRDQPLVSITGGERFYLYKEAVVMLDITLIRENTKEVEKALLKRMESVDLSELLGW